jgi:hypothetical protein
VDQDETPTDVLPESTGRLRQPTEPAALARYAERIPWDSPQHPAGSRWEPNATGTAPDPPTQTLVGLGAPVPPAPAAVTAGQPAGTGPASPGRRRRWLRGAGIAIGLLIVAAGGLTAVKLTAVKQPSVVLIHPARPGAPANTVTHAPQGTTAPQQAPAVTGPSQAASQPPAAQAAPPPPAASAQPVPSASAAPTGSTTQAASPPAQPPTAGATSAPSS